MVYMLADFTTVREGAQNSQLGMNPSLWKGGIIKQKKPFSTLVAVLKRFAFLCQFSALALEIFTASDVNNFFCTMTSARFHLGSQTMACKVLLSLLLYRQSAPPPAAKKNQLENNWANPVWTNPTKPVKSYYCWHLCTLAWRILHLFKHRGGHGPFRCRVSHSSGSALPCS